MIKTQSLELLTFSWKTQLGKKAESMQEEKTVGQLWMPQDALVLASGRQGRLSYMEERGFYIVLL